MAEVILALDVADRDDALRLLDRLPSLRWVKLGSVLVTREGPALIAEARSRGLEVFLDLKWHDIPNTVAGAVTAARDLGVAMTTVHTLGGSAMMEAAAAAAGPSLGIVGVTVLTSHDPAGYAVATGRTEVDLRDEVVRQGRHAMAAGLRGVVCSPGEVARLRGALPGASWLVVPGIRRPGDPAGDQQRTAGPREAAAAGATHLVVGRPILQAPDPAGVLQEMQEAAG